MPNIGLYFNNNQYSIKKKKMESNQTKHTKDEFNNNPDKDKNILSLD